MRDVIASLEGSKIREVANVGMGRPDVLPFWFGESDEVTADVIRQAAIDALQAGQTFYSHNLGLPELRQAIANYTQRLHPAVSASDWLDRIAVTSGRRPCLCIPRYVLSGFPWAGSTPAADRKVRHYWALPIRCRG